MLKQGEEWARSATTEVATSASQFTVHFECASEQRLTKEWWNDRYVCCA